MDKNYKKRWILLMLFLIASLQVNYAQNIIPNPSFEVGSGDNFDGWSKWNGATSLLATSVESEVNEGSRALKAVVTSDGNPWSVQFVSDPIPTVIGESYTFTAYVKGEVAGTEIRFSTNPNALYSGNYIVSETWTQVSWTFTANEVNTRIVLDLGANANTYFIDTMEMLAPPSVGENIVPNPSFELGSDDTFTNWSKFNGATALVQTTEPSEVHDGNRALKAISTGGNAWSVQIASDLIPTTIGESYTFKIYVKGAVAGTSIRFSTSPSALYSGDYTVSNTWTLLSWTFTANATETRIVLDLGADANTYFLDSMEMLAPVNNDPNLVLNGSFEGGSGDFFENWGQWNGDSSLTETLETNEVKTGSRALKATVTTNGEPYMVQMVSDPIETTTGATYEFQVYAKALTEGSTIRFSTNPNSLYSQDFNVGTDWTLLSWSFIANSSQTRIALDLGKNANTYFLDDAQMQIQCGLTFYTPPASQTPIASGKNKFLGTIYDANDANLNKYFNQITPENAGKWGSVEVEDGVFDFSQLDAARAYAAQNNFPFRFHVLVWGNQQPTWLKPMSDEEKVVRIKRWFQEVAGHYDNSSDARKTLEYIEVVNEILNDKPDNEGSNATDNGSGDYLNALRSLNAELNTEPSTYDWVVNAFKLARLYFPCETKLMINEYGIENTPTSAAEYVSIIELLKKDNLVDVVGMQGHSFSTRRYGNGSFEDATNNLSNNLNLIADTGLPIMITEMDIDGDASLDANGVRTNNGTQEEQDAFQLSEYQRIFGLYWNHPSVIGITLWGYRSGMWRTTQEAYLMNVCDGSEKPAMSQYLNTVIRNSEDDLPLSNSFIDMVATLSVDPSSQQYSDDITIKINVPGGNGKCGIAAQLANIYINGILVGEVELVENENNLEGSLNLNLLEGENLGLYAPGTKTVTAVFDQPNEELHVANAETEFNVTPEDAKLKIIGGTHFNNKHSSSEVEVTLNAMIEDEGELSGGSIGDITNSTVRFLLDGVPVVVEDLTDENGYLLNGAILPFDNNTKGKIELTFPLNVEDDNSVKQYQITLEAGGYYQGSVISQTDLVIKDKKNPKADVVSWPNPTDNEFHVSLSGFKNNSNVNLKVINYFTGATVYSTSGNADKNYTFGLNFQSGLYFLIIEQGNIKTSKFIIKK
ncbi:endo-1,4-beta-xylanase [Confluentibacter citreus]|uniref:endo-1,4-beta-xylanase n=1 Tax=Confluentibacter citreus TaxID=2007307 RepID=UPI000C2827F9|nr:endo-1,4-beta-xylanase [Confluentibacter citreus]